MTTLTSPKESFVEMIADLGAGAKELAVAHTEQLREELATEGARAHAAIALIAAGGIAMGVGLVFALYAVAIVLNEHLGWPAWASWLSVAIAVTLIGFPLWYAGYRRLQKLHIIPHETLQSIGESMSWIANARR